MLCVGQKLRLGGSNRFNQSLLAWLFWVITIACPPGAGLAGTGRRKSDQIFRCKGSIEYGYALLEIG